MLEKWKEKMRHDIYHMNNKPEHSDEPEEGGGTVERLEDNVGNPTVNHLNPEPSLPSTTPSELMKDQRRAFDLVTWHLKVSERHWVIDKRKH